MRAHPVGASQNRRIVASLPFVEALARRMASSMPNSIDIGDLVQDGVLGLIDAAHRFDEGRGIKFETFAERRVRGAMIDALRRDAWPRGVRRQRRELEAAREALRRELGHEPSLADLAARVGSDERRLGRTIVRINTIESTSPLAAGDRLDESSLPPALVPSEPDSPDLAYEKLETRERVRAAIRSLPWRERKVIGLYYYGEVTMKQIGAEIGVNESRVSQLHARAVRRLRDALGQMQLLGCWIGTRHPLLLIEADGIDDERVALPMSDGMPEERGTQVEVDDGRTGADAAAQVPVCAKRGRLGDAEASHAIIDVVGRRPVAGEAVER